MIGKTKLGAIKDEYVTHALDWVQIWREVCYLENGTRPGFMDESVDLYKQLNPDHCNPYIPD